MSRSHRPTVDPPSWLVGSEWSTKKLRQPGWLLLPLRIFLAVTFCYAGLQKLANPSYFDASNPASVTSQMRAVQHASPIGALIGVSLHTPIVVGLLIAVGELAVGVGAFVGLWTRIAAIGGIVLSMAFFLTVSWSTSPYYLGADIVFVFAWITVLVFGAADVCSVDAWLHDRARQAAGLPVAAARISVDADRLRTLCPHGVTCGLRRSGVCSLGHQCPVFPTITTVPRRVAADLDRRRLLLGTRAAAVVGVAAAVTGGVTATAGRLIGGTRHDASTPQLTLDGVNPHGATEGEPSGGSSTGEAGDGTGGTPEGAPSREPGRSPTTSSPPSSAPGTPITHASTVPVGQAGRFQDPTTGSPAWLVHTKPDSFVAFSAVCTHAGCTVDFVQGAGQFYCPCHGGRFDASTGDVLVGPPRRPLAAIPVHVVDGEIRVG